MSKARKNGIRSLLNGIETGDPHAVDVIDPRTYIQHNPQTDTGREGLRALFARLSKTSPRVNLVRVFSDGDYVFAHTEYDFASRKIGFEVFRYEGEFVVEHWDNTQERLGPNASGRSMVGGPTEASDTDLTETNRCLVRDFVEAALIGGDLTLLDARVAPDLIQHSPRMTDGRDAYLIALETAPDDGVPITYRTLHRVLAEGCFVLAVSECERGGRTTAVYDLFRVEGGMLVEHWDTVEAVVPKSEWNNNHGKF